MAILEKRAVTVLVTEQHLRKMIEDHLLKETEISDRVKALASYKSCWTPAWAFRTGYGTSGMIG